MTTSPIDLTGLVSLPELQLRTRTDPATVKRYAQAMKAGALFPPIRVADLDGQLLLVDGFHRIAAMQTLRIPHAEAEVIRVASLEEARWEAGKANLVHGLRLKPGERRGVFRAYVKASQHRHEGRKRGPLKSYRGMAKDLGGIPHTTLRNWMKRDFPSVFAAMGGDDGEAPGGLLEPEPYGKAFARQASAALDEALAAIPGVADPVDRGLLLAKVDDLKAAIEAMGVEEETPF